MPLKAESCLLGKSGSQEKFPECILRNADKFSKQNCKHFIHVRT